MSTYTPAALTGYHNKYLHYHSHQHNTVYTPPPLTFTGSNPLTSLAVASNIIVYMYTDVLAKSWDGKMFQKMVCCLQHTQGKHTCTNATAIVSRTSDIHLMTERDLCRMMTEKMAVVRILSW